MLRLCRHISKSVSTRVADSGNQTTQVDALSGQVDTGSCSQNSYFQNQDSRSTQYQSRSTLDQFPEQPVSRFG
ncbi:hypothetical protein Taro_056196 [Colocasia esculenta]|uniref:Uncharacterized protein n=1 Tax=Colocasia esculenta TaxID=4460 RepID=A0A843XVH1_COLES|nr:hypothetical protein [Colocasia esculenta]